MATHGAAHIDGDFGMQSTNPAIKKDFEDMIAQGFNAKAGKAVDAAAWHPYYQRLIQMAKNAQKDNSIVIVSFFMAGIGPEGKKWLDSQLSGLKHIYIDVPKEELLRRFFERNEKYLE